MLDCHGAASILFVPNCVCLGLPSPLLTPFSAPHITSMLLGLASICIDIDLGLENEVSTARLYTTIGLAICDLQYSTERAVVHSILDAILWASVSILN